ncbi:MAG: hypothetical protein MUO97_02270 [Dehalococcoidia bacterium]|nr:hypothetical protein [Dehalococcoidia bacterium]
MFYVSIGLIAISVIILAIDFFQKKEEETIRTGITTVIDFAKMTPEQIAQFMDRVKDMSSAQIETLLGGQYAKTIKEAKRHTGGKATKISSKTKKEGKKGRKA